MKMSSKSAISKELNESIRLILGKNVKIPFKCAVRMETKSDKTENKVLVFAACRVFVMAAKVPSKIDFHFHYLEIQAIESKRPNQLSLTVGEKVYTFYTSEPDSVLVDRMILQLGVALKNAFPLVPLEHIIRRIEVVPPSRNQELYDYNKTQDSKEVGPCGNFSVQYSWMCDYHSLPYRDEVAWDVDTIYLSHDARELSLQDFDHLEQRDLIPIISALEYNTWFTKLRASNVKLATEATDQILQVMRKSLSIEELYLDNMGLKWDFVHKLSLILMANGNTPIHTVDLSNNFIEEKGAPHLVNAILKLPKGLVHLNLAKTGLTTKGVNMLANALTVNRFMATTLTYLNLADNLLKEEVNNLFSFLAQPNTITHLDLSGTDVALDRLFDPFLRGCTQNLSHVNLSRNPFSHKKSKDVVVPTSLKQFFMSTIGLKLLNLSATRLPPEALKNMLLGLACNESAKDVELDLTSNMLGSQGAHVMETCISNVRGLASLDISDNGLEVDLANVITSIGKNKSLRRLAIGRNFTNIKSKHMASIMEAIVQVIQEDDSAIEHLSLADSKLKGDIFCVINALGSNSCLVSMDISGNQIGDSGARLLAKALQINNHLKALFYDRNNISAAGFCDLAYALKTNYTMRFMPFPIFDACLAMKTNPERTDSSLKRIENLLHRNVSPKKFSNGQAFRLQQGFLLSSTQQMVDRLVVQTQDLIKSMKYSSVEASIPEDVLQAEAHIKDADKSKQLLTRLHDVILQREEAGNPIDLKLTHLSDELHRVIQSHLQGTVDNMLKCAEDQCPVIMSEPKLCQDLQKSCKHKSVMSSEFVRQCIVEQAGTDIVNKANELNLAVASHISDRIIDEVIESLSRNYKELLSAANSKQNSTPDVLRRRTRFDSDVSKTDGYAEKSDSPEDTPHLTSKRKSMQTRKLRPQSVVDNTDLNHIHGTPDLLRESKDDDELEDMSPQRLQHLSKGRPRRQKTRAPSRSNLRSDAIMEDDQKIGEGVDMFFQKSEPATPIISPSLSDDRSTEFARSASTSKLDKTAKEKAADTKKGVSKDKSGDSSDKEKKEKGGRLVQGLSSMISRMTQDRHSKKGSVENEKHKADIEPPPPAVVKAKEEPEKEVVPEPALCQPAAIPKVGVGGNILAEIKARQEKRLSLHREVKEPQEKERDKADELPLSPKVPPVSKSPVSMGKPPTNGVASKLISEREEYDSLTCPPASPGWKCKPENMAAKLVDELAKANSSFPPRPVSSPLLPKTNESAGTAPKSPEIISPTTKRAALPPKPKPPPIAPKPRPRSMVSPDLRKSGEFSPGSDVSSIDGSTGTTPERGDNRDDSVDSGLMGSRDSLTAQDLTPDSSSPVSDVDTAKRKAQSLPRNTNPDIALDSTPRSRSMSCKEPRICTASSSEDLNSKSRRPVSVPHQPNNAASSRDASRPNDDKPCPKETGFHVDDVVNV